MRVYEGLTNRQFAFVLEYCKDFVAVRAYIRAGYSEKGAQTGSSLLLANPKIQAAIEERKAELAAVARLTPEWVLKQWMDIASANPEEIVKVQVTSCPSCYDSDTRAMFTEAALSDSLNVPNPECPTCRGEGLKSMLITDTRRLSGPARRLYAGAQQTKDGIKILFRNQDSALDNLSKYLGMIINRGELSGPGGGPVPLATVNVNELTDEQLAALCGGRNEINGGTNGGTLLLEASNQTNINHLEAASSP